MSNIPADLQYTGSHEWIRIEGEQATVGITDFAQAQLGDVVYVELPEVGASFDSGANFGVIESVKAASDLYLPVAGEIIEVNSNLDQNPDLVNSDPYGDGWLVKIRVAQGIGALMSAEAYSKLIAESDH
jgi:glycine cleavage system H protein